MIDRLTRERRSRLMSRVRSKDTTPEMRVRRAAFAMGYRYRLHRRDLPGCPDLVFVGRRKVVFVHGCFWHRHPGCSKATMPKSKIRFWKKKFEQNVDRDQTAVSELQSMDWKVLTVWECETKDVETLRKRLQGFLEATD